MDDKWRKLHRHECCEYDNRLEFFLWVEIAFSLWVLDIRVRRERVEGRVLCTH